MKKIILGMVVFTVSLMAVDFNRCAGCHGKNAEKSALGKSKIIKGWSEDKTISALQGYKNGSYGGPMKGVMKGQVAAISDTEIKELAVIISKF